MKLVICAGPPTSGKSSLLKQCARRLLAAGERLAYLKIDVRFSDEEELFGGEMGIPARSVYSGDLCPDHCSVLVLGEAVTWAAGSGAGILLVETAGLCLRCAPYVEGALGIVVLEATSGINLPRKIGAMLGLADLAVVTKIDLVSQAEKEVFKANLVESAPIPVVEADTLHGINVDPVLGYLRRLGELTPPLLLKGSPPMATCTICAGKKEIGWEHHAGLVRGITTDLMFRGQ